MPTVHTSTVKGAVSFERPHLLRASGCPYPPVNAPYTQRSLLFSSLVVSAYLLLHPASRARSCSVFFLAVFDHSMPFFWSVLRRGCRKPRRGHWIRWIDGFKRITQLQSILSNIYAGLPTSYSLSALPFWSEPLKVSKSQNPNFSLSKKP